MLFLKKERSVKSKANILDTFRIGEDKLPEFRDGTRALQRMTTAEEPSGSTFFVVVYF